MTGQSVEDTKASLPRAGSGDQAQWCPLALVRHLVTFPGGVSGRGTASVDRPELEGGALGVERAPCGEGGGADLGIGCRRVSRS